jgi:hypothetical protein
MFNHIRCRIGQLWLAVRDLPTRAHKKIGLAQALNYVSLANNCLISKSESLKITQNLMERIK